jgi:uncharacterized delta-60 repeat protein
VIRALGTASLLVASAAALALPPGSLDPTFGNGGVVRAHAGPSRDEAAAARLDASGRIVVAGTSHNQSNTDFALVRYTGAGALDTSFGDRGRAVAPISAFDDRANALAVQPDGKYVVAGSYLPGANDEQQIAVARFTTSGALDATFGSGGIVVAAPSPMGSTAGAVAVQPDGKIVVAATVPTDSSPEGHRAFLILRYTAAGAPDSSFGNAGAALVSFGASAGRSGEGATAILVQPDGRILVGGTMTADSIVAPMTNNLALVRLNVDGTLDAAFGTGGKVLTYSHGRKTSLALQPDGKIVAGGGFADFHTAIAVFRYNANGSADTGFGTNGKAMLAGAPTSDEWATDVALQPDGRIVATGQAGWVFVRFTSSGAPDSTFGTAGRLGIALAGGSPNNNVSQRAVGLLVQPDGKIVGFGTTQQQTLDFAVVRLLANGTFDTSFGAGSSQQTDVGNGSLSSWTRLHVRPDNRVVATGTITINEYVDTDYSYVGIAAFNANGAIDASFGTNGVATTTLGSGSQLIHRGSVLQPDGKLVVAAYHAASAVSSDRNLVLLRYTTRGVLDDSFGSGGKVLVPAGFASDAADVALQPDGKIILLGRDLQSPLVYRFSAAGVPDTGFGSSGVATVSESSSTPTYMRVAVRPDGKIVLVYDGGSSSTVKVAQLTPSGMLDATFGTGGTATIDFLYLATFARSFAFGLQPDGKIVVATARDQGGRNYDLAIARLLANGAPDPSFGAGLVAIRTNSFVADEPLFAGALSFQPDGKIVIAGSVRRANVSSGTSPDGEELAIFRLTSAGALDASFGAAGVAMTPTHHFYDNNDDRYYAVAVGADGRVVAMGAPHFAGDESFMLARYLTAPGARAVGGPDFDANGANDLLWTRDDGRYAIWLMNATSVVGSAEIMGAGSGWSVASVADLDGNGKSDLVWQHSDGRVAIWLMNGSAPATQAQILNAGGWRVTHAGDFNGDGKADLVFSHADGSVAMWTMNGTASTGGATILGPGSGWSVARIGDFDGDGKSDLLWAHADGRHAIWLMDGTAPKAMTQVLNAGAWSAAQVADLNGDGKSDILWQHADGSIAAWVMDGATLAMGSTLIGAGTGWTIARAADFDGDGHADLLFQHPDGRAAIWLMWDSRPSFVPGAQAQVRNAGEGWIVKRVIDMDGDGRCDIVWQHADGRVAVWLMNGTTLLSGQEILPAGTGWHAATLIQ